MTPEIALRGLMWGMWVTEMASEPVLARFNSAMLHSSIVSD